MQTNVMEQNYTQANKADIDRWIHQYRLKWAVPISHEEHIAAKNGQRDIRLMPVKSVPHEWLESVSGKRILGLASGGGQQMLLPYFNFLRRYFRRLFPLAGEAAGSRYLRPRGRCNRPASPNRIGVFSENPPD